jgi:hypothetical protein
MVCSELSAVHSAASLNDFFKLTFVWYASKSALWTEVVVLYTPFVQ